MPTSFLLNCGHYMSHSQENKPFPKGRSLMSLYLTYIKACFDKKKSVQKLLPGRWMRAKHTFLKIAMTLVIRKDRV